MDDMTPKEQAIAKRAWDEGADAMETAALKAVERGAGCLPHCNDRHPCVMDDTCPGAAPREHPLLDQARDALSKTLNALARSEKIVDGLLAARDMQKREQEQWDALLARVERSEEDDKALRAWALVERQLREPSDFIFIEARARALAVASRLLDAE